MSKPTLRQPPKSPDPTHSVPTSSGSLPTSGSDTVTGGAGNDLTPDQKASKMSRTIHGIRELVMLADEHDQQKDYRRRVRESHQAMGEVAGFHMPDYDEDAETSNNFVVAAEGSTVNLGQDNQPATPPPAQQPQQRPANGFAKGLVLSMLGAGLLGTGAIGTVIAYKALAPDPPAKVAPVEPKDPPKYNFTIE